MNDSCVTLAVRPPSPPTIAAIPVDGAPNVTTSSTCKMVTLSAGTASRERTGTPITQEGREGGDE